MTEIETLLRLLESSNATILSLQETLKKQQEDHKKEVDSLLLRIDSLTAQLANLQRMLFGKKSEKLPAYDSNWPGLFDDQFPEGYAETMQAGEDAAKEIEKETPKDKKTKRQNRRMLEDLPVLVTTTIEPRHIDLEKYRKIGEERTRLVHIIPRKLYVEEIIRPKYGLIGTTTLPEKDKSGIVIADMPLSPIYKGIPGASLLAEILLNKYEYHLPFYRQIKQFEQLGMKGLTESTVDSWFKQTADLLRPLYDALSREVFNTDYIQADETVTPVIDHEKKKAAKEYLWMVRSVMERLVIFHYDDGSRAGTVIKGLADRHKYKGYLQCDGYTGYESAFTASAGVRIVNCMAHIRRYFEKALGENKAMADHALSQIQLLYKIERQCDEEGVSFDERKERRQRLAKPIMDAMKMWMETEGVKYGEETLIGKAVTYAYCRWDNMARYLEDGRIRIDNNLAENEIRPITLGRKNYLFCGNHDAARNMAVICSLLSTCRNHNVNPRDYLNDIIARLPYMQKATHEQLAELLPHKWQPIDDIYKLYNGGTVKQERLKP